MLRANGAPPLNGSGTPRGDIYGGGGEGPHKETSVFKPETNRGTQSKVDRSSLYPSCNFSVNLRLLQNKKFEKITECTVYRTSVPLDSGWRGRGAWREPGATKRCKAGKCHG